MNYSDRVKKQPSELESAWKFSQALREVADQTVLETSSLVYQRAGRTAAPTDLMLADIEIVVNAVSTRSTKRDAAPESERSSERLEILSNSGESHIETKSLNSRSVRQKSQADDIRRVLGLWDSAAIPRFN